MNIKRKTHKINELPILSSSIVQKNNLFKHIAKGDSGASQHYVTPTDQFFLHSKSTSPGPTVLLPNNQTMTTSQQGILSLSSKLSPQAQTAYVLPKLHTSLISLGQLADDNCTILLNKTQLKVFKSCQCIINGHRNTTDGLWDIPLHNSKFPSIHKSNIIIPKQQNIQHMLQYLHAYLFSPPKSTLLKAI